MLPCQAIRVDIHMPSAVPDTHHVTRKEDMYRRDEKLLFLISAVQSDMFRY